MLSDRRGSGWSIVGMATDEHCGFPVEIADAIPPFPTALCFISCSDSAVIACRVMPRGALYTSVLRLDDDER